MMMTPITPPEAHALAALVAALRPEWDPAGIYAAIREARNDHDTRDLCHAAVELAFLPEARTPKVLIHAGPHWQRPATAPVTRQRPEPTVACDTHGGITRRIDSYGRTVYACCFNDRDEPYDGPVRRGGAPMPTDLRDRIEAARTANTTGSERPVEGANP